MNVSAIIVTRGDVDLRPIWDSLPPEWEQTVWDNGLRVCATFDGKRMVTHRASDLSVYGRYAAIEFASHELVYVQDDDVIVSDPQAIVDEWRTVERFNLEQYPGMPHAGHLVANMPPEFCHGGYVDSCLVGFGAAFHRDAPARAFDRVLYTLSPGSLSIGGIGTGLPTPITEAEREWFYRTCDVVFTTLTPRVLEDVPKVNLEFAEDESRMYRQAGHVEERQRMLELARKVRDA